MLVAKIVHHGKKVDCVQYGTSTALLTTVTRQANITVYNSEEILILMLLMQLLSISETKKVKLLVFCSVNKNSL